MMSASVGVVKASSNRAGGPARRVGAMKTATKNLLTQLQSAAVQNGDVYVSIVPFSKDVNVDPTNYSANWIDWTDWNNKNGSCSSNFYSTKTSCQNASKTWTTANHNTWNGCVVDRPNYIASGRYHWRMSIRVCGGICCVSK